MKLTGEQQLELRDALVSAFPTRGDLAQLATFGLEEHLASIAAGDDLRQTSASLITWAVSRGRVPALLAAAYRLNPGNPDLQAFRARQAPAAEPAALPPPSADLGDAGMRRPPSVERDSPSAPLLQLQELDSPLSRHDTFFRHLFEYLRAHVYDPANYGAGNLKGRVLGALEACLPVRRAFFAALVDGVWQTSAKDAATAEDVRLLLDRSPALHDLMRRAWEHGRNNIYFSRNVTTCQLSVADGLCLLIPSRSPQGLEVLVLYGACASSSLDITIAVAVNALLDITANFTAAPPSDDVELALHNAIKRQFGYVSDYMYNRQFAVFKKRLQEITMVFEPIVSLHSPPRIHSWEALARDPQTLRAPRDLFAVAELWGQQFRTELDLHCLHLATQQYLAALPHERDGRAPEMPDLSVNVNPDTLLRSAYRQRIDDMSRGVHGFPVNKLILEISESFPLPVLEPARDKEDPGKGFRKFLKDNFRRKGVRFAVDDFGVGHASSQRLLSLGADIVKIDRYALLDNYGEHLRYLIQQAADVVGHDSVIVEGYDDESKFTLKQLRDLDVWFIQGYRLGRASTVITELSPQMRAHICRELDYRAAEQAPLGSLAPGGVRVA